MSYAAWVNTMLMDALRIGHAAHFRRGSRVVTLEPVPRIVRGRHEMIPVGTGGVVMEVFKEPLYRLAIEFPMIGAIWVDPYAVVPETLP